MKAVILAGGLGTRISEETYLKPKPMIEIGGKPILWHILKMYSSHGVNEFIICCGYKGYVIKEYFANYFLHMSDVTFDMQSNSMEVHHKKATIDQTTITPWLFGKPADFGTFHAQRTITTWWLYRSDSSQLSMLFMKVNAF